MLNTSISPLFFLVFGFVLAIVLQAWFVRRLSYLRGKAREGKDRCDRLHAEATELSEAVSEFDRGLDSNATSVQMLQREIEDLRAKIADLGAAEGAEEPAGQAADLSAEPNAGQDSAPAGEAGAASEPPDQDVMSHASSDGPGTVPPPAEATREGPPETSTQPEFAADEPAQA